MQDLVTKPAGANAIFKTGFPTADFISTWYSQSNRIWLLQNFQNHTVRLPQKCNVMITYKQSPPFLSDENRHQLTILRVLGTH